MNPQEPPRPSLLDEGFDYEIGWCELRHDTPRDATPEPDTTPVWNSRIQEWRLAFRQNPAVQCPIFYGLGVGEHTFDIVGGKQPFAVNVATGEYATWNSFCEETLPIERLLKMRALKVFGRHLESGEILSEKTQRQVIRATTAEAWISWKEKVWHKPPHYYLWLQENMFNTRFTLRAWRPTEHDELRAYINMWKNIEQLNRICIGAKECGIITDVHFLKGLIPTFLEAK